MTADTETDAETWARVDESFRAACDLSCAAWDAARQYDGRTREGRAARAVARAVDDGYQTLAIGARRVSSPRRFR